LGSFKYGSDVHWMMSKIQVTFSDEQLRLIEKFRGKMGNTQAAIVKNIVIAWLAEKSFISDSVKKENPDTFSGRY